MCFLKGRGVVRLSHLKDSKGKGGVQIHIYSKRGKDQKPDFNIFKGERGIRNYSTRSQKSQFILINVQQETTEEEKYDGGDEKTPGHQQESHKLEEIHKQQLSANSKVILLADIGV